LGQWLIVPKQKEIALLEQLDCMVPWVWAHSGHVSVFSFFFVKTLTV